MKLKALDNFHATSIGQDIVRKGQEFEVHDALGQELADKGLAEILEASTDTDAGAAESEPTAAKREPTLDNKAEPELSNKTKRRREKAEAARQSVQPDPEQPFPEPDSDED